MEYWITVAGTGDRPFVDGDWKSREAGWIEEYGRVHMFSRRPTIAEGDRLVSYAAGSHHEFGEGRIFKLSEAAADPEPSPHPRWPWQVRVRTLIEGPRLEYCPELPEIDVQRRSLGRHSHIRLRGERGPLAERLLARAAEEYGGRG